MAQTPLNFARFQASKWRLSNWENSGNPLRWVLEASRCESGLSHLCIWKRRVWSKSGPASRWSLREPSGCDRIWMRFYLDQVLIYLEASKWKGVLIWNVPEAKSSFRSFQMQGWCWWSGTFQKLLESSGSIQKWWRLWAGTFWKDLEVKMGITWMHPANPGISWIHLRPELRAAPP